ncbi:MAG: hypothetical protein CMJ58_24505 [Planctomycetaceae bacterium]|nr:hypothetical protein [Planctomycetaceae bacterium]
MSVARLVSPLAWLASQVRHRLDRIRLARYISRGMRVGKNVYITEGVEFDSNYPFLIEIGDNCRICRGVRILTHDATVFRHLGATRLAPVRILEGSFIGERAIIMPGVTIGPDALIAAGALVNRDIGSGMAAAGNPARPYGTYADLLQSHAKALCGATVIRKEDVEQGRVTVDDIRQAVQDASAAYIRGVPRDDPWYVNAEIQTIIRDAERAYRAAVALSATDEKTFSQPSSKLLSP